MPAGARAYPPAFPVQKMADAPPRLDARKVKPRHRLASVIASACLDTSPIVIASSVLINVLSLFMPLAILQVYDRIIPDQAANTLVVLVIMLAAVLLTEAMFRIARNHVVGWASTALAWRTHREVLRRVMAAPAQFLESESASRNLDRIQALLAFAEWHGSPSRLVMADLPFVVLFIGLMAAVGQWLVLVPLLLFCILAVAVHRRSVAVRQINESRAIEDMKTRDFLVETFNGIQTIKASAMENQMQRRFERLQETVAAHSFVSIKMAEETQAFTGLLSNLTQMATVTVGAAFVINGQMSVGALACCVMLAGRAVQPLLRCVAVWNELQSVIVGIEKSEPLLNLPGVQERSPEPDINPMEIHFSDVSFAYRPDGKKILDRISFRVPAGRIVAVTGRDGTGKSTLADIVCGNLPGHEGEIRIGGLDPRSGGAFLKRRISMVRPGISMMRGTIIDNITMFRKGTEEAELAVQAARLIGLDADICKLPLGYRTVMSDGVSAELPTGLVQRIAIARAIARRPGLLILDEANGALDMQGDKLLLDGLRRLRGFSTILLITNRPSFAAVADQIWRFADGRLEPVPASPATLSLPQLVQAAS